MAQFVYICLHYLSCVFHTQKLSKMFSTVGTYCIYKYVDFESKTNVSLRILRYTSHLFTPVSYSTVHKGAAIFGFF
jgi:hypothetical protein